MLEVIKQHRDAVEEIQPSQEFNYLKEEARKSWDGAGTWPRRRLSKRPSHRAGPNRHHRLPHGLRYDRHRAGHRAREIQTAGGRRHAEDSQSHGARGIAPAGLQRPGKRAHHRAHREIRHHRGRYRGRPNRLQRAQAGPPARI